MEKVVHSVENFFHAVEVPDFSGGTNGLRQGAFAHKVGRMKRVRQELGNVLDQF
jgi:hypothetical protein